MTVSPIRITVSLFIALALSFMSTSAAAGEVWSGVEQVHTLNINSERDYETGRNGTHRESVEWLNVDEFSGLREAEEGLDLSLFVNARRLSIKGSFCDEEGASWLNRFAMPLQLEWLWLDLTRPAQPADLKRCEGRPLRRVSLSCPLTPQAARAIASFESIQEMELLGGCASDATTGSATSQVFEELERLPNLRTLRIKGADSAALRKLEKCVRLKELQCSSLGDSELEVLCKYVTQLVRLDLGGSYKLTIEGIRHLSNLTNLRSLDLFNCSGVTDEVLKVLGQLTGLTDLRLGGDANDWERTVDEDTVKWRFAPKVTAGGIAQLVNLKQLMALDLSLMNAVTSDFLLKLASNAAPLRKLVLAGCELDDASLRQISNMKNLETLDLSGRMSLRGQKYYGNSGYTRAGFAALFKGCQMLQDLYLDNLNCIAKVGTITFEQRGFRRLSIRYCDLVIVDVWKLLSTVEELDVSGNECKVVEPQPAERRYLCKKMTACSMAWDPALLGQIIVGCQLETLDVRLNELSAQHLPVSKSSTLRFVDLRSTGIKPADVLNIAKDCSADFLVD